ncbi:MAG: right-handed parallel beta-helix repeat-containing protein [Candidatus Sumerlaeota bacterium]|nr:right-handed parallel beta-helix repeat-containing protein [Candidatus Sumerlaeota bacterium]
MSGKSQSKGKNRPRFSSFFFVFTAAVCFWSILSPAPAHATTCYVSVATGDDATGDGSPDKPWKTLAAALYAAPAGTETSPTLLLMAVGTYPEGVSIEKSWTSVEGGYEPTSWTLALAPAATILDGGGAWRPVTVGSGLRKIHLQRLTIANGKQDYYGGGIGSQSDIYLDDCEIRDCHLLGGGAGVDLRSGIGHFTNCTFSNNADTGYGGAILGTCILDHCTVSGNTAGLGGGGIYGDCTLQNHCLVSGNHVSGGYFPDEGGGIYGHVTASDSRITGNSAGYGGGIGGTFTLTRCEIRGNSARYGGGLRGSGAMTDCVILSNKASTTGGGLYGNFAVTRCTISQNTAVDGGGAANGLSATDSTIIGNTATGRGGGIYGSCALTRCAVDENTAGTEGGGAAEEGGTGVLIQMTDCDVMNNAAGTAGGGVFGRCTLSRVRVVGNRSGTGYIGGVQSSIAQIENCLIWNNPGGGMAAQSGWVKHCTIADNPRGSSPLGIGVLICGAGATVANNVIVNHEVNILESVAGSTPAAVRNNLLSRASSCQYWANGNTALNTQSEINSLAYAQGNVVGPDPLFLDDSAGDLHLQAGSPCIDAGSPVDSVPTDYDKNARPAGAAPDIGAFESGYPLPPHWPSNPQPPDDAGGVSMEPTFQWSPSPRATQYDLFIWRHSDPPPLVPAVAGLTQTTCTLSLNAGWRYYWKVMARNSAGQTPSDIWAFAVEPLGPPSLESVTDDGGATAQLAWSPPAELPAQFLGFAWDIYQANWVQRFWNNTMWQPFADSATTGTMDLGFTGAYHVWISSQYLDGYWVACVNPWTGILYSGTPHTPVVMSVEKRGGLNVRLHWTPEIYGTWHNQIIAYKVGEGFPAVIGPSGNQQWHFIDYGALAYDTSKASFLNGWADFTLPSAGDYWLLIRGVGWLPPYPAGEYGTAFVSVP